ncbi:MAG: hypothetical protein ACREM1_08005 [Longimicrobiales bacterium]
MGLRSAMMPGLIGLAAAASSACTGDTLYDTETVPPPAVEIVSPMAGEEFAVGDTIDVQVLAEDSLRIRELEITFTFMSGTDTVADTVRRTIDPALEEVDETTSLGVRDLRGELELRAAATNELNGVGESEPVTVLVREP